MDGCKGSALLVGMLLCTSACAPYSRTSTSAPPSAPAPTAVTERTPLERKDERLERVLAYAARSRSFSAERLEAEYGDARAAARRIPSAESRVRLAILLAHPHAPFRDDARARRLLREAARAGSGIGDLARVLQRGIDERNGLERALARERARRGELQQKLEQLKTIEQEIDRRAPASVVPERQ